MSPINFLIAYAHDSEICALYANGEYKGEYRATPTLSLFAQLCSIRTLGFSLTIHELVDYDAYRDCIAGIEEWENVLWQPNTQ